MRIIEAKYQDVVACILVKKNKILISTRPYPKIFHGYYEFPGGKVSSGEFLLESLFREIKEELDLEIDLQKVIFLTNYSIKIRKINLYFFTCTSWKGKISAKEGQKLKWVKLSDLKKNNLLRSNQKVLKFILGSKYLFPACN